MYSFLYKFIVSTMPSLHKSFHIFVFVMTSQLPEIGIHVWYSSCLKWYEKVINIDWYQASQCRFFFFFVQFPCLISLLGFVHTPLHLRCSKLPSLHRILHTSLHATKWIWTAVWCVELVHTKLRNWNNGNAITVLQWGMNVAFDRFIDIHQSADIDGITI